MNRAEPLRQSTSSVDRPWLRHYDALVPHTLEYPNHPLQDFLSRSALKYPDQTCTIMGEQVCTYAHMNAAADRVASALVGLGVKKGDRVGILMPNVPEFVLTFYAILKAGAVVVALNPMGTSDERAHQIHDAEIELIIVLDHLYPAIIDGTRTPGPVRSVVVVSGDAMNVLAAPLQAGSSSLGSHADLVEGDLSLRDLVSTDAAGPIEKPAVEADDTALLQYSGGTTGPSKAAVATHRGVVANTIQFRQWLWTLESGRETILLAIPLYHAYGMIAGMSLGIALGARLALVSNSRDLDSLVRAIKQHRPTVLPGVPGMYNALCNHPGIADGGVNLASLRVCISGSTALMRQTKDRFERLTGGRICEGYGLSEAPVVTHCNPLLGPNKIGSIGMPMPDVDCRIVDPEPGASDVAPGEAGELILRGPQLMRGYHHDPAETSVAIRTLADGKDWLFTGDIARMDEDGYFYLVDRKKDVMKPGGFQVWPWDVEEVLSAHPAVLEVGVAGVLDSARGEIVKAWVVVRPGGATTVEELQAWCRQRMPHYGVPTQIEFRSQLPKSNVGKVLRRELARQHAATLDAHDSTNT